MVKVQSAVSIITYTTQKVYSEWNSGYIAIHTHSKAGMWQNQQRISRQVGGCSIHSRVLFQDDIESKLFQS